MNEHDQCDQRKEKGRGKGRSTVIVPQVFWVYSVNSSLAENVVMLTKYHSEGRFCSLGRVTTFHYAACSAALQEVPSMWIEI